MSTKLFEAKMLTKEGPPLDVVPVLTYCPILGSPSLAENPSGNPDGLPPVSSPSPGARMVILPTISPSRAGTRPIRSRQEIGAPKRPQPDLRRAAHAKAPSQGLSNSLLRDK
jgi:hypothetical protein